MTTTLSGTTILIIDSEPGEIQILSRMLDGEYRIFSASSGQQALSLLEESQKPDLILLDLLRPGMGGYELCAALKQGAHTRDIPVIFVTTLSDAVSETKALAAGAVDFIRKPVAQEVIQARVRLHLEREQRATSLAAANTELAEWNDSLKARVRQQTTLIRQKLEEINQQNARNQKSSDAIVLLLADLLDQRNRGLSRHSRIVSALAASMANYLDLPVSQIDEIRTAAILHDIGLIGMSDRGLVNNSKLLSGDDLTEHRAHPVRGQEIIGAIEELQGVGRLIRHHHEEFDGKGFPDGLAGEDIPLGGRIISLASFIEHCHSSMTGRDINYQVCKKVAASMGTLFDPGLTGAMTHAVTEVLTAPATP
jgi:response regulator RpfG family c-di-GMP phosphodiesterase